MKLSFVRGLLFTTLEIEHQHQRLRLERVLVDTGSYSTLLPAEPLLEIGVRYESTDTIAQVRGVGGTESVIVKTLDCIRVDEFEARGFTVHLGNLDYGFNLDGILGLDFLMSAQAVIDLKLLELRLEASS